jgi:hypothetical protein
MRFPLPPKNPRSVALGSLTCNQQPATLMAPPIKIVGGAEAVSVQRGEICNINAPITARARTAKAHAMLSLKFGDIGRKFSIEPVKLPNGGNLTPSSLATDLSGDVRGPWCCARHGCSSLAHTTKTPQP